MMKQVTVTGEGLKKMKEELDYLKNVRRKEVSDAIGVARSFGDLSENSEYDEAKNEQAKVEAEIAELEDNIKHAVVLDETKVKSNMVNVGSVVKLRNLSNNMEFTYTIVGSTEADPMAGRISDLSPIGRAIIGTKKGDKVKVERDIQKFPVLPHYLLFPYQSSLLHKRTLILFFQVAYNHKTFFPYFLTCHAFF